MLRWIYNTFVRSRDICDPLDVEIVDAELMSTNPIVGEAGERLYPDVPPDYVQAKLAFDREFPSYAATLVVQMCNGSSVRLRLWRLHIRTDENGNQKQIKDGSLTNKLLALPWSPSISGYGPDDLVGCKARLYSHGI